MLGEQGEGSSDQIVSAIQWAVESGADGISMSLGMDLPGLEKQMQEFGFPLEVATSRALEGHRANVQLFEHLASLIRAFNVTTITLAAAGKESQRDENPDFKIAVSPPAVSEGIISVGALGQGSQGGRGGTVFKYRRQRLCAGCRHRFRQDRQWLKNVE